MYKIHLKFSVNAPAMLTCLLKQENRQRIVHFIDNLKIVHCICHMDITLCIQLSAYRFHMILGKKKKQTKPCLPRWSCGSLSICLPSFAWAPLLWLRFREASQSSLFLQLDQSQECRQPFTRKVNNTLTNIAINAVYFRRQCWDTNRNIKRLLYCRYTRPNVSSVGPSSESPFSLWRRAFAQNIRPCILAVHQPFFVSIYCIAFVCCSSFLQTQKNSEPHIKIKNSNSSETISETIKWNSSETI